MSDFKLKNIGTYTYTFNKMGKPMIRLVFDGKELAKVKEVDLDKIYIYEPKKTGGQIIGLVKEEKSGPSPTPML